MKHSQDHWVRRFFASRLFLVIGAFVLGGLLFGNIRAYYREYTLQKEIDAFDRQVQSLKKERLESLEILQYVMSDAFVEEKARVELGMKGPGEHVIVIGDHDAQEPVILEKLDTSGQVVSNPVKWWYYFTHQELPAREVNSISL